MQPIRRDSPHLSLYQQLSIDCARCCGLCCTALCLLKSADFPENKPAGSPCRHLLEDFRCAVHRHLGVQGRKGCIAYDCFGAGQFVTQVLYAGRDWHGNPGIREAMYADFRKAVQASQMLWYLAEAACLAPCQSLYGEVDALIRFLGDAMARADLFAATNLEECRAKVNPVLKQAGAMVAARFGKDFHGRGGSYLGQTLQGTGLRGRDFSMSLLIAANLQGCDLAGTNFLGADLRDTNLQGADLRDSVFLTQSQVNAARGDVHTRLPPMLSIPATWKPPARAAAP